MKSIVKRCSVAVVLALAALLPDFTRLHTSMAGLELIANLEGCRLSPYQCSAGVWTSGIGHTAGVKPGGLSLNAKPRSIWWPMSCRSRNASRSVCR